MFNLSSQTIVSGLLLLRRFFPVTSLVQRPECSSLIRADDVRGPPVRGRREDSFRKSGHDLCRIFFRNEEIHLPEKNDGRLTLFVWRRVLFLRRGLLSRATGKPYPLKRGRPKKKSREIRKNSISVIDNCVVLPIPFVPREGNASLDTYN